jgi:general secretion pathway protein A
MFLQYYGMREQPFGVTPSPYDLYLSATHREALASLFYGVEAGRGFMALIAKPGMGKTTLLFRLLQRLESSARTVFLFHTQCDSREFFGHLLADLGIDSQEHGLAHMHDQLNQVLLAEARAGRRFVLVIDEAQNLDDSVLETVRLLSDFETPRAKLMHIILAGQPQLAEKLARPGLVQLRQRISLLAHLEPFSLQETRAYIDHRLKAVGYVQPELFTPEAMEMIAARSEGIPRNINNICFNALSLGYALEKKKIDRAIVQEVLSDLNLGTLIEEASGAPQATLRKGLDVQELIGRDVQRGSQVNIRRMPVLQAGVLGAAVFLAIWLVVFLMGKPKSENNVSVPQAASASSSQTSSPSGVDAASTNAKTIAHPDGRTHDTPLPLPSNRTPVPGQSEENHAGTPPQAKRYAKARKDAREQSKVRKVPSRVPATKVLSPSRQAAGDATSATVGSAGESAPVAARGDLRTYREAVQQSPLEPATHHNLAHALQTSGDLNGAAAEYRQALRLGPGQAESHIGLASVLLEKGNFDGALVEFRAAARLKPDDPRTHYGAGLVLYAKGDPASLDSAMSEYREAIRLRPGDADVHYALGSAFFQKRDFDAAISEYREALRLAPDRALVREQLSKALLQKGDARQPAEN